MAFHMYHKVKRVLKINIYQLACIKQHVLALENFTNNDQQLNTHDFLIKFNLSIWYIDFVMATYIINGHVC